jgi:hypothetical protein
MLVDTKKVFSNIFFIVLFFDLQSRQNMHFSRNELLNIVYNFENAHISNKQTLESLVISSWLIN